MVTKKSTKPANNGGKSQSSSKQRGTSKSNEDSALTKHEQLIAADKERTTQIFGIVEESVGIMSERLRAGDSTRDTANTLLSCLSNRFDRLAKPDFHSRFGYDHNADEIYENLKRIDRNLSRKTLVPTHGRLDTVLNQLVSEAFRLVKSQSTFCESCEHCLRERYPDGDALLQIEGFSTEATLNAKMLAYILERFSWPDELGESEIVLALRHIESLAVVGRSGAVTEIVNKLIDAMATRSINPHEIREAYEAEQLAFTNRMMAPDEPIATV